MSAHPALDSASRFNDRTLLVLTVVNSLIALALGQQAGHLGVALALAGAAVLGAVTLWRLSLRGLWGRVGFGLLNVVLVLAQHWLREKAKLEFSALEAMMPITLCLMLPYRDWRPITITALSYIAAEWVLEGADALWGTLLMASLAGILAWVARGMAREAAERFELEFLVNAMGRDGPIRLNLDAVRTDSPVGQRLKHVQGRMVVALREVRDAISLVQGAAQEVGSSAVDLRERTDRTANGLRDAALSLEQINVIVQESARASRDARAMAASAGVQAQRGGQVVGQLVSTMQDINKSSRRITDIIGTIDAIAFQTNILALNAAVEAARAGEAGRGFAVVATEVRMLAGRSSEAAREIKSLIAASLETVERGSKLAGEAGGAMDALVQSVQGVGEVFNSLTADSAEHAASIDVVTASVKELDGVTGQNVSVAVRGGEIASELLQEAVRLAEVLSSFRLGGDDKMARLLEEARAAAAAAAQEASRQSSALANRSDAQSSGGVDFF